MLLRCCCRWCFFSGLARATYEAKQAKDKEREAKSKDKEGAAEAAPADSFFNSPPSSVMVMYGNILYDWSQVGLVL
jgi:hypothetical protein